MVAAVSAAVGTALRQVPPPPTGPTLWWQMAAIAGAVLTLLGRHRFPFAAPAAIWVVCAALSVVDGALVPSQPAVLVAGLGSALLLGSLRDSRQALTGLAVVVGGAAVIVADKPSDLSSDIVFTPLMFAIGWLAGYALRERTVQTEAAEERAAQAERERESATRLAVAEERARIARELHDVVAHALSVMVLQVGVVRRRRPPRDDEDSEALRNVEEVGRAALTEMRWLLAAMRQDGDRVQLGPQPGLGDLDALLDEVRSTGLDVRLHVRDDGRGRAAGRGNGTGRTSRRGSPTPSSTPRPGRPTSSSASPRPTSWSRCATTAAAVPPAAATGRAARPATAWSASASA